MTIEGGAGCKRKSANEKGDAHDTGDAGGKAARHGKDVPGGMHGRERQGEGAGGGEQGYEVVTFDCASFREPYASVSICTCTQAHMHTDHQNSLSLSLSLSHTHTHTHTHTLSLSLSLSLTVANKQAMKQINKQ
jgi:hypothetical protein